MGMVQLSGGQELSAFERRILDRVCSLDLLHFASVG